MRFPPGRTIQGHDSQGGGGQTGLRPIGVLQGVGFTFVVSLACALVIGLAVAWTGVGDASDSLLKTLNLFAVAAGGWYAGRKSRRLGWMHGGLTGLLYIALVSWMIGPQFGLAQFATAVWLKEAAYAFGAGAAGGVLGVAS